MIEVLVMSVLPIAMAMRQEESRNDKCLELGLVSEIRLDGYREEEPPTSEFDDTASIEITLTQSRNFMDNKHEFNWMESSAP